MMYIIDIILNNMILSSIYVYECIVYLYHINIYIGNKQNLWIDLDPLVFTNKIII